MIKVRATKQCFVDGHRRRKGEEFYIESMDQFGKNYMEKVKGAPAEEETLSDSPTTVKELKAALDAAGVEYPAKASKDDLIALLAGGNDDEGAEDLG